MEESLYAMMRSKERFTVHLKVMCKIKDTGAPYQECLITNLSSSGAAVILPNDEALGSGAVLEMDIAIPDTIMHISVEAEIMWVRKRFSKLTGGISFKSMLSDGMVQKLVKKNPQQF